MVVRRTIHKAAQVFEIESAALLPHSLVPRGAPHRFGQKRDFRFPVWGIVPHNMVVDGYTTKPAELFGGTWQCATPLA